MLGFFSFGFGLELPAGRKTVQESSQQAQKKNEKFMSQTATTIINENHKLGLKFFVRSAGFTWLYVQLHEIHNYNTDSILSIDCVIPKGIQ